MSAPKRLPSGGLPAHRSHHALPVGAHACLGGRRDGLPLPAGAAREGGEEAGHNGEEAAGGGLRLLGLLAHVCEHALRLASVQAPLLPLPHLGFRHALRL